MATEDQTNNWKMPNFDEWETAIAPFAEEIVKIFQKNTEGKSELKVLDFGCGPGFISKKLLTTASHCVGELVGADVEQKLIKIFDEKINNVEGSEKVTSVLLEKKDGSDLKENEYDFIIVSTVLGHVEEELIQPVLSNLCKSVKQGGKLLLVDFEKWEEQFPSFSKETGDKFINEGGHRHTNFSREDFVKWGGERGCVDANPALQDLKIQMLHGDKEAVCFALVLQKD
eukprot:snap_masked-scaffold_7-processed-gene-7.27-mRNA-1 protein AED:1.00 eAED:1.00 QI:0/-1/0/0/-1/1/1/0/227